jgi:guanylate kinase
MHLQEAVDAYHMPERARRIIAEHPPLGLAGPTGAGKSTMAQYLTQIGEYAPTVSDTTRAPRPFLKGSEVNGVHYWFLSEAQALEKLSQGGYIEAKVVHGDTLYGTSIEAYQSIVTSGRTPILDIDIQGMEEFMRVDPSFEAILLLPPNFEVWNQRIDSRGDMTAETKLRRFGTALIEYSKPLENARFFAVVNTEVIEAAEVIRTGAYRSPEYREQALKVAAHLHEETRKYLDSHAVS